MAEARQSKQSPAEIYAWSVIDFNLPALQAYANSISGGAAVAGATTTTTNPFQTVLDGIAAQFPEAIRPYAPAIILGGAALLAVTLLGPKGR